MDTEILDLVEEALDGTLRELLLAQARPAKPIRGANLAYWFADDCSSRGADVLALAEIASLPTAAALKAQLHTIGWLLFRLVGSTEPMKDVAEWVAALDIEAYEARLEALYCAFAGVGQGDDVWA